MIIVTSSEQQFRDNAQSLFGYDSFLIDRYTPDKLLAIQDELLRQTSELNEDSNQIVENVSDYTEHVKKLFDFLLKTNVI